jgi:hypothetical protein
MLLKLKTALWGLFFVAFLMGCAQTPWQAPQAPSVEVRVERQEVPAELLEAPAMPEPPASDTATELDVAEYILAIRLALTDAIAKLQSISGLVSAR